MYKDNLSVFLLRECYERNLSYEMAAELCNISERHFGNIVRRKNTPSVNIIERMCDAFDKTPNDLLLPPDDDEQEPEKKKKYQ